MIYSIIANDLFIGVKKTSIIRLNLVKSNLLTFHSHYNAHSSHLFNSQIHFPTLVRGKFLSSQTPSSTRSLPYFSRPTSHGVSRPWANPLANAKTTLYPPPPRCLTPAFIFLEFASRDSSRLFSSGAKFSSL